MTEPAPTAPDELARTDRLGPALAEALGDSRWRSCDAELITGGKSNLTFFVRSAAGEVVLRRPPTGPLLPRAHDVLREARVQQALARTAVPVPDIVLTDDGPLIGVPCYVMGKVPGVVIRDTFPAAYSGIPHAGTVVTDRLVDTLAGIHGLDLDSAGLADYGRPEGALERQVRLWTRQWGHTDFEDVPAVDELARRLGTDIPRTQRHSLVHGDFRLDNCVMGEHDPGHLAAVLDWELSALGDPLTDLAMLLFVWRGPQDRQVTLLPAFSASMAMPDRRYVRDRYADASGLDLTDLRFYLGLAHLKFAVITAGIVARGRAGAMGGQDFADFAGEVGTIAEEGLTALADPS